MNIKEFRTQYPEYENMSDDDLAASLHQKFYSDLPYDDFRSRFVGAPPKPAGPPTTTAGEATEFVKGIPGGFVKSLTSTVRGGAALVEGLFPETLGEPGKGEVSQAMNRADTWVNENVLPPSKGYEQSKGRSLGESIGGFASLVGPTFLPRGILAASLMLGGQGADAAQKRIEAYEKETNTKVDPIHAEISRITGGAIDALTLIPIIKAQKFLDKAIAGALPPGALQSFGRIANMAVMAGGPAGAISVLNDITDKVIYNPNVVIGKNFWEALEHGAETGALWQIGVEMVVPVLRRRARARALEQRAEDTKGARREQREEDIDREVPPDPRFDKPPTADEAGSPERYAERIGREIELYPGRYQVGEVPGRGYEVVGPRGETITPPIHPGQGDMARRIAEHLTEQASVKERRAEAVRAAEQVTPEPTEAHIRAAEISREPMKPLTVGEMGHLTAEVANQRLRQRGLGERDNLLPGDLRDSGMKVGEIRKILSERFQIDKDITPLDVAKAASDRNIIIDKNFEEFSKRVTGSPDALQRPDKIELSALKATLEQMPVFEAPTSLPIVPRPRFSKAMYDAAVDTAMRRKEVDLATIRSRMGLRDNTEGNTIAREILAKMEERGIVRPSKDITNAGGRPHRNPTWAVNRRVKRLPFGQFELYVQDSSTGGKSIWSVMERQLTPHGEYKATRHVARFDSEAKALAFIENQPKPPRKLLPDQVHPLARQVVGPERAVADVARKVKARRDEAEFDKKVIELLEPVLRRTVGREVRLEVLPLSAKDSEGQYFRRVIALAKNAAPPGKTLTPQDVAKYLEGVLDHEAIHATRELDLYTDAEWKGLVDKAWPAWGEDRQVAYRNAYGKRGWRGEKLEDILREEAVADYYRAWRENPSIAAGPPATLFQRIIRFFKNLIDAVNGNKRVDVENLLKQIEGGEIGKRERGVVRAVETAPPNIRSRADEIAARREATEKAVEGKPSSGIFGRYDPETRSGIKPTGELFSLRPHPQLYSRAVVAIRGEKQEKNLAQAWLARLRSQGIKEEELQWTGLKDFLAEKTGKEGVVSRQELLEVVSTKMVDVADVVLEQAPDPRGRHKTGYDEIERAVFKDWIQDKRDTVREVLAPDIEITPIRDAEGNKIADGYRPVMRGSPSFRIRGNAKVVDNTGLPIIGAYKGVARKETAPPDGAETRLNVSDYLVADKVYTSRNEAEKVLDAATHGISKALVDDLLGRRGLPQRVRDDAIEAFQYKYGTRFRDFQDIAGGSNYTELLIRLPRTTPLYTGAHHKEFDNVVSHARLRTREEDGKKILHALEIQSDWHQNGRDRGYSTADDPGARQALEQNLRLFTDRANAAGQALGVISRDQALVINFLPGNIAPGLNRLRVYGLVRREVAEGRKVFLYTDFNDPRVVVSIDRNSGSTKVQLEAAAFLPQETTGRRVKIEAKDYFAENGHLYERLDHNEILRLQNEVNTADAQVVAILERLARKTASPDAPFKDSWPGLTMKRLIAYAIETGHTHVAWADGATISAARGKGLTNVRRVAWYPETGGLWVGSPRGYSKIPGTFKTRNDLTELVGRDAADAVMSASPRTDDSGFISGQPTEGKYHIADLSRSIDLGSPFFRLLYDQQLPSQTNKIIQKYGAKVERMDVQGEVKTITSNRHEYAKIKSHGFEITDALRNEVNEHGLPLFSLSREQTENLRKNFASLNPVERSTLIGEDASVAKRVMEGNRWKKLMEKTSPSGAIYYKFAARDRDFFLRIADHSWRGPRTRGEFPEVHFDWLVDKPFEDNLKALRRAQRDRFRGVEPDEPELHSLPYVSDKASPETRKVIEDYEAGNYKIDEEFLGQYAMRRPTPVPPAIGAIDWTFRRPHMTFGQKILSLFAGGQDMTDRAGERLRMHYLDHIAPWERLSQDAASRAGRAHLASTSSLGAARQVGFTNGIFSRAVLKGVPTIDALGYARVTNIHPIDGLHMSGLVEFSREVARRNDWDMAAKYSYAIRGRRLDAEGREQVIAPADASTVINHVTANMPWIVEWHRQYQRWNSAIVEFAVKTGFLNRAMADVWRQHSDYIPFYRQLRGETLNGKTIGPPLGVGVVNIQMPHKLEGGPHLIGDFTENITRNAHGLISAALRNEAGVRGIRDAEIVGIAQRVPMDNKAEYSVTIRKNGQAQKYIIDDPLIYMAMTGPAPQAHPIIQTLGIPARVLRELVTKDPAFMIANMLRDTASTWAAGRDYFPVAGTVKGFAGALMETGSAAKVVNAGVFGSIDFAGAQKDMARKMRQAAEGLSPVRSVWRWLEKTSNASDVGTRAAVYESVLKKTGDEAQAILEAGEALNFNRHGASKVMRALTTMIPFLNARIQGMDVLYRSLAGKGTGGGMANAKEIQKKAIMRMVMLTGLGVAYYNTVSQTEQWKTINQDIRDNYYIFPLGKDLPILSIPVPFEVGLLTKIIPERILAWWDGRDTSKDFFRSMASQAVNTFQINPIPQAAKPIIEAWTNFSFFRAQPIEGLGVADLLPSERFHQGTPETMKQFSKYLAKLGIELSPARTSALISGYTGQMGSYALMAGDWLTRAAGLAPPAPADRIEDYPIIKRFLRDRVPTGVIGEFYEMRHQIQKITSTSAAMIRQGRFDDAMNLQAKSQTELSLAPTYNSVSRAMSSLRNMRVRIMADPTMDGAAKRTLIDQIRQQEVLMAEQVKEFTRAARRPGP